MTSTLVLKFGGEVVADPATLTATLRDVAALTERGARVLVCHGAGPQAGALQEQLGLRPTKVDGRRVTCPATLRVVKCVLAGEVNVDVVAAAMAAGVRAVGIAGVSDAIVGARRRPPTRSVGGELVDLGLVGIVERVRTDLIEHLWRGGFVPVLSPLGLELRDDTAQVYNINADTVAAAVAAAVHADHLLLVTAVGGIRRDRDDPSTRIGSLHATEAMRAIADGTIVDGMIPKVEEALGHLALGIGAVHILPPGDGILAQAVERPGCHGTVLLPDPPVLT